jgi:hypothetical protein
MTLISLQCRHVIDAKCVEENEKKIINTALEIFEDVPSRILRSYPTSSWNFLSISIQNSFWN